ncbi:type II toxin-antitoxin system RelE/ParE family toxin [Colibacter massiliensis]|nr:type II toxin-antitoxin system RelE/ParE family toxin [Colibacter massiliensis]
MGLFQYVLLHHFRKKSQKTPKREISLAKAERDDYIRRKEVRL